MISFLLLQLLFFFSLIYVQMLRAEFDPQVFPVYCQRKNVNGTIIFLYQKEMYDFALM